MKVIILFIMLFMHIVDDYYLQGILANLKQRSFWEHEAPDKLYRYDYIVALLMRAFSWAFMITVVPLLIIIKWQGYTEVSWFLISVALIVNVIVHAVTDNLKANAKKINLIHDQLIHITQVIVTWLLLLF